MTREDLQELQSMIAQIHCQLKQGALPSGLVVCYANAETAEAFERILNACEKMLGKEAKMSRKECQDVVDLFNKTCPSLPSVKQLTDARLSALKSAKAVLGSISFQAFFEMVEASDFLSGRSGKWSGATFDWILKKSNLVKIIEGNYDRDAPKEAPPGASFDVNQFYEAALNRSMRMMEVKTNAKSDL